MEKDLAVIYGYTNDGDRTLNALFYFTTIGKAKEAFDKLTSIVNTEGQVMIGADTYDDFTIGGTLYNRPIQSIYDRGCRMVSFRYDYNEDDIILPQRLYAVVGFVDDEDKDDTVIGVYSNIKDAQECKNKIYGIVNRDDGIIYHDRYNEQIDTVFIQAITVNKPI